jgi:hypothetical protein
LFTFNYKKYSRLVGNQKHLVTFKLQEWWSIFFGHQLSTHLVGNWKIWSPSNNVQQPHVVGTWEHHQMATKFFQLLHFLGAPSFGGTPNLTYIRNFKTSFFLPFFFICMTLVVLDN